MIILEYSHHPLQELFHMGKEIKVFGCNPCFDTSYYVIQIIVNFVHLPVFQQAIDVITVGALVSEYGGCGSSAHPLLVIDLMPQYST